MSRSSPPIIRGNPLNRANTWAADQTYLDNIRLTLGTGGDADVYWDGTDLVIDSRVVSSGRVVLPNGAEATPSWVFSSDKTMGMYRVGAKTIGLSVDATRVWGYGTTGMHIGNTTVPGAGATNYVVFINGSAESSQKANAAGLYSKDVASSSEMFAMGEDGTESQISPHPADFLATLPTSPNPDSLLNFPWAESHSYKYLGGKISVDMAGVVAWVEGQAGRSFHTVERFPKASWEENEREKVRVNTEERRLAQANGEKLPPLYKAKPVLEWQAARGAS